MQQGRKEGGDTAEGCHEVGNDSKSGRRDAAEGGGESSGTSSTQNSPRKPKSRNARKCLHEKKRKDRNRGEVYEPEHDEERGKE